MRKFLGLVFIFAGLVLLAPAQAPARPRDYTAHVVGYAHMDIAWLWRWQESIYDIMYNTFRNQLELMDQFPDYTYAQDRPVVSEMMERYFPDIFKGIVLRQ
jgi:alpha-mannosidase